MDSMSLRLSKLTLCLYLAHLCVDLEKGRNEHPTGKFESNFVFLSYRP